MQWLSGDTFEFLPVLGPVFQVLVEAGQPGAKGRHIIDSAFARGDLAQ